MIVCIDSGNSRAKWGIHDGATWLAQGAVTQGQLSPLADLVLSFPLPERVMLANVAGPAAAAAIGDALAGWRDRFREVRAVEVAGGVRNGYARPGQLGVDRWCALVGAWGLVGGACLVVGAGTATTIDTLDATGRFVGGLILPGLDLMRASLARNTAGLPLAEGAYAEFPRCTEDAIASGALEATAGAVERACRRLGEGPCLLFGGAAPALLPRLPVSCRAEPLLVLEGLRRLAGATAAGG